MARVESYLYSYLDVQPMTEDEWNVVLVTNRVTVKGDARNVELERCHICSNLSFPSRQDAIEHVPFYANRLGLKPLGMQ